MIWRGAPNRQEFLSTALAAMSKSWDFAEESVRLEMSSTAKSLNFAASCRVLKKRGIRRVESGCTAERISMHYIRLDAKREKFLTSLANPWLWSTSSKASLVSPGFENFLAVMTLSIGCSSVANKTGAVANPRLKQKNSIGTFLISRGQFQLQAKTFPPKTV